MRRSSILRWGVWGVALVKLCALAAFPGYFIKKASEARVELDTVGLGGALTDTFFVLKLLIKPFQLMGFSTPISISLTMLVVTLIFQLKLCSRAGKVIWRGGYRVHRVLIVLILFAPAVNFFSAVALRDALLYVLVAISVAEILCRGWEGDSRSFALLCLSTAMMFLLRPEMAVILIGVALVTYCSATKLRAAVGMTFFPLLLIVIGYASSLTASYAFNMEITDPFTMLDQIRESRFQRQFKSDGGGSAIMAISVWENLGAIEKYGAQVIATLFMPLSLSNINYALVAIDSLLLIIVTFLTVLATKGLPSRGLKILAVVGSLMFVVLFLAPFVVNFGNGFRLRLMVWAVVTGIAVAIISTIDSPSRERNGALKLA